MNQSIIQLLAQQFNENMGNKITTALAHGIMISVDQWQKENEKPTEQSSSSTQDVK